MIHHLHKKHQQSGRSTVETLGVLVIIGLLSIGGILGYRQAMDKHIANDILSDVLFAVQEMETHQLTGKSIITTSFQMDALNNTVTIVPDVNSYAITVSKISQGVCQKLFDIKFPDGEIRANPASSGVCNSNDNEIYFYRTKNEARFKRCETVTDCGGMCYDCVLGVCVNSNSKCASGQNCDNGYCSDCPQGQYRNRNGVCISCDTNDRLSSKENECYRCLGEKVTEKVTAGFNCTPCDYSGNIPGVVSKEDCITCSNRVWYEFYQSSQSHCWYCDPTVSALSSDQTQCIKKENCEPGSYWMAGKCYPCTFASPMYDLDPNEAKLCKGVLFAYGVHRQGHAYLCSNQSVTPKTTFEDCTSCEERYCINAGPFTNNNPCQCAYCPGVVTSDHLGCIEG